MAECRSSVLAQAGHWFIRSIDSQSGCFPAGF